MVLVFFEQGRIFESYSCFVFFLFQFILSNITYGVSVPSGLFIPCIIIGCSYGRLIGDFIQDQLDFSFNPAVGAFVGAVSILGGTTRATLSLTVIILETTNEQILLPIMIECISSKLIGSIFCSSIYNIHIKLKGLPFIRNNIPLGVEQLIAKDFMSKSIVTFNLIERVDTIKNTLKQCKHNGFPVILNNEQKYCDIILRRQLDVLLKVSEILSIIKSNSEEAKKSLKKSSNMSDQEDNIDLRQ